MTLRATSSSGSALPGGGTTSQALIKNSNTSGDAGWATLPGGGNALTTSSLAQFAATTSAQLAGVMSDETGTGALVFGTSPTLVTPALGTPTTLVLANAIGLPLTAGVTGILPIANGGSGTATPGLVAGTNISITGSWPNQTVTGSDLIAIRTDGSSFTLASTDGGGLSLTASTITITVPTQAAGFNRSFKGAGVLTFTGSGVTITDERTTGSSFPYCEIIFLTTTTASVIGSKA